MPEPKKETVQISPSPGPEQGGAAPIVAKHDTARIVLPAGTPVSIRRLPPKITPTSPLLQPLPKPPGIATETERPVPHTAAETSTPSVDRSPKKETARISVLPRPAPAPAINMPKTQRLLVHPAGTIQPAPVVITSKPFPPADAIPRPLCWALLGISAVIFLIQIWNYVVS